MSANFLYSNTALPSLITHQQQQHLVTQRSRSASTSNAGPNVPTQYQVALSQPYQTLGPMDGSWTQTQGLYVNGLNKMMNIFPGQNVTEMEQTPMSQPNEPTNGNTAGNHGSVTLAAAPQVHFAVAATPNGLVQPHTGLQNPSTSMRSDQTTVLHSTSQHPSGQSFLIPGIVGQQPPPTLRTLTQDNLSPSVYREPGSTQQSILSSGTKQTNNLNSVNNTRDLHSRLIDNASMNQSAYVASVPVQQHPPVVSHHHHPHAHQLYTSPTLQPPSLHGMVEYVQAVYPTNPNIHIPYSQQQQQQQQQSATAIFSHYPAQMNTAFDSTTMHTNFNSRVRHNTWTTTTSTTSTGLEDNSSSAGNHDSSIRKMKNDKVLMPNDYASSTLNEYNINSHGSYSQYPTGGGGPYFTGFTQSSFYQPDSSQQKTDLTKQHQQQHQHLPPGSITFQPHNEVQKQHACSYQNPASLQYNSSLASITNNDISYITSVPMGQLPARSTYHHHPMHSSSYLPPPSGSVGGPSCLPVQNNNNYNTNHNQSSHMYNNIYNSENLNTTGTAVGAAAAAGAATTTNVQQSAYPVKDNYPRGNHKPREWNKSKEINHHHQSKNAQNPLHSRSNNTTNNTSSSNNNNRLKTGSKSFASDRQQQPVSSSDRKMTSSNSAVGNRSSGTGKQTITSIHTTTTNFIPSAGGAGGLMIPSIPSSTVYHDFNSTSRVNTRTDHVDYHQHSQPYVNSYASSVNQQPPMPTEHCINGGGVGVLPKHLQTYQPSVTHNSLLPSCIQSLPENFIASLKLSGFRLVLDSCPTRMLLSTSLVGSVIGRGGRTIRQITTKTGAKIGLKQDIITFSQFSLPGKGRKTFKPAADPASSNSTTNDNVISNKAEGEEIEEEEEEEVGSDEKNQSPDDNKDATSTTPSTTTTATSNNPEDDGEPTESTANPVSESESPPAAAATAPPPPISTLQSKLEIQSDQSQLAVLYGSREQCSAALYEILTICFRESKHRGFSDPCLGLLVEQQIYSQLIMNKGKKYFNAIHAATGARISVTGTPLQISSTSSSDGNDQEKCNPTGTTDRVLVVRGHLNAICAAEAFLSEQIRWATIESVIPSHFWPLLNHLPSIPLVNNHKSSNTPFSYDPQSVCSLIMSLGSIFWPQSVCAKLGKNSSLQYNNNNNKRSEVRNTNLSTKCNSSGLPENDTTNTVNTLSPADIHDDEGDGDDDDEDADGDADDADVDIVEEENHEGKEDLEYDAKTLVNEDNLSEMNSEGVIQEGIDDNPANDKADDDNNTSLPLDNTDLSSEDINEITVISVSASDMEDKDEVMTVIEVTDNDKTESQSPPVCIDSGVQKSDKLDETSSDQCVVEQLTRSTMPKETNLVVATAVQQSLIAAVGPIAWLATGGILYMRVSYNEAGALIGTEGSRIQHLMHITGAEINVGKVQINPPYAISPSTRTTHTANATTAATTATTKRITNSSTQSSDRTSPTCISLADSFLNNSTPDENSSLMNNKVDQSASNQDDNIDDDGITSVNSPDATESLNATIEPTDDINNCNDDEQQQQRKHEVNTTESSTVVDQSVDNNNNEDGGEQSTIPKCPKASSSSSPPSPSLCNDNKIDDNDNTESGEQLSSSSTLPSAPSCHSDCGIAQQKTDIPHSKTIESKGIINSANQSYRLITLSGSAQSQIMAQWQIFQRLKSIRKKQADSSNDSSFQRVFCLATLICLPYRFLWWLTTHNPGFSETSDSTSILTSTTLTRTNHYSQGKSDNNQNSDHSNNNNKEQKSGISPLNWIQLLASKHMNANYADDGEKQLPSKFIHVLPEPRRRRRLVQQQLKRIMNASRRGGQHHHQQQQQQMNHVGNCLAKALILPTRGLSNDGLDQLWAHPNRIPLEIYADFETTQLVLKNLHHMLALWLYGQSLAGTSIQSFIQPPIIFYPLPNTSGRPGNLSNLEASRTTATAMAATTSAAAPVAAHNRPYSQPNFYNNNNNYDQFDYWTFMPNRQHDAFFNSPLRHNFPMPLLPGGGGAAVASAGVGAGSSPYSSAAILPPDRCNYVNFTAQPYYYPRYPWMNLPGIPSNTNNSNNKYSGQATVSDAATTATRGGGSMRVGPPALYGYWPRGRFNHPLEDKHNIVVNGDLSSQSTRFPSPGTCGVGGGGGGYTAFLTNLHFPPTAAMAAATGTGARPSATPFNHIHTSVHPAQVHGYHRGSSVPPQPKFRFRNPCSGGGVGGSATEPFILKSMPLLDTPNHQMIMNNNNNHRPSSFVHHSKSSTTTTATTTTNHVKNQGTRTKHNSQSLTESRKKNDDSTTVSGSGDGGS
ncbi:unnamed protein product [Trichobilharzia szidati]|nr:unnamed protein product [Trichobilharzia szidati]